jgi:hypothetical protein
MKELHTKMKSFLLSVSLLFSSVAFAQGQGFHRNAANGSTTPPTPAQMAQNQTNHLTKFFSLTSTQQTAVLGILTPADTQIAALRTQIQTLRTTLVAAVKANNPTEINSTLAQISPLQQQIESLQAVAAGQIYATVLTPAQQGQLTNGLGPLMGFGPGGFGGR